MKLNKKFTVVCALLLILPLTGCGNKDVLSMKYDFKYAEIKLMDGTVKRIKVKAWSRDEKANNIRVTSTEGESYYSSSDNILLIDK